MALIESLPSKEGWLTKEGNYMAFQTKVFVKIQFGLLTCYRSADTQNTAVLHTIVLQGATVSVEPAEKKIRIRTDHDAIILVFESEDDLNKWNAFIQRNNEWKLDDYYAVDREVAKGEYCRVSVATHKHGVSKKKQIAIKSIDRERESDDGGIDRRRKKEIDILTQLNHPNLMYAVDVLTSKTHLHIVQPYMNSGTLRTLMQKSRRDPESAEMKAVFKAVLEGLRYLHSEIGVVHRDIKPENIFLGSDGEVRMGDFGLATYTQKGRTDNTEVCGTPNYVAPESLNRENVDGAADLWAVGVILFEALTEQLPFDAKEYEQLFEQIKKGDIRNIERFQRSDTVSQAAKDLVRNLIVVVKERRFTSEQALSSEWFQ